MLVRTGARPATDPHPPPDTLEKNKKHLKPESEWRAGVTTDSLIAEMDKALQFLGISNAWTMAIKARIDMLATGMILT